jgi:hypothetical protein
VRHFEGVATSAPCGLHGSCLDRAAGASSLSLTVKNGIATLFRFGALAIFVPVPTCGLKIFAPRCRVTMARIKYRKKSVMTFDTGTTASITLLNAFSGVGFAGWLR